MQGLGILLGLLLFLSGCGGKSAAVEKTIENSPGTSGSLQEEMSTSDRENAQKLMEDYFIRLFSMPVEEYAGNIREGRLPTHLREFFAQKTLEACDGNPYLPVHFPRFVQMGDLTAVQYEILMYQDSGEKEKPEMEATFLGVDEDVFHFFVKLELMSTCIPTQVFDQLYSAQEFYYQKNLQTMAEPIGSAQSRERVRLCAMFDLELVKEENTFKILSAVETGKLSHLQYQVMKENNDSYERLPYLRVEDVIIKSGHLSSEDQKVYAREKEVITSFFNCLKRIDHTGLELLKFRYVQGKDFYLEALRGFTAPAANEDTEKAGSDISAYLKMDDEYLLRFGLDSFPLKSNMDKINDIRDMEVIVHPAYTDRNKEYIVKFRADVGLSGGLAGSTAVYRYDYFVNLEGNGEDVKITGFRLNEYYREEPEEGEAVSNHS